MSIVYLLLAFNLVAVPVLLLGIYLKLKSIEAVYARYTAVEYRD